MDWIAAAHVEHVVAVDEEERKGVEKDNFPLFFLGDQTSCINQKMSGGFARAAAAAAFAAHEEAERAAEESRIRGTFNRQTTDAQRRQQVKGPTAASMLGLPSAVHVSAKDGKMPDAVLDPSADFVVDLEGIDADKLASDVPVTTVQLDALALLAIAKHAANSIDAGADRSVAAANRYDRDHTNTPIGPHGSLLGLDVCGFLEVASALPALGNAMAVNPTLGAEINPDALESPAAAHHARLLNGIATLGFDSNVVGFYVCAPMGAFWSQALLDALYGLQKATPCAVLVVYDPVRTAHGNLSLRALRLTQQTMSLMATKKFTLDAIHAANVTSSTLFESVPLQLKNSALAHAMLATLDLQLLTEVASSSNSSSRAPGAAGAVGLHPHFDALDLGAGEVYLEKHLEALYDAVDDYGQEQWRWQGWNRSLQKEQQKAALCVAKKRGENAARESAGLTPVHTEADIVAPPASLTRVLANEPSRLETLVLAGQVDTWCKQIHGFAGPGLTKMYLTKAVSRV